LPIPLFHSHNVKRLSLVIVCISSVPANIMPFNDASMPLVAFVLTTAITMPLLSPLGAGCRSISYNLAVAVSPSYVLIVSIP